MGNKEKIVNETQIWRTQLKRNCPRNDFTHKFWDYHAKNKSQMTFVIIIWKIV
jgi:hypothetical protein